MHRLLRVRLVMQAALDVFSKEPPVDNPLVGRPDVVCTPHLGASTTEAQEGVSVEIAEAVVSALKVLFLVLSFTWCLERNKDPARSPLRHLQTVALRQGDSIMPSIVIDIEHMTV